MITVVGWRVRLATGMELHVEELGSPEPVGGGPRQRAGTAAERADEARPGPGEGAGAGLAGFRGTPDTVPVLLVHGIAGSTADWAKVAGELAESRRVVVYDQRGHGISARAEAGRSEYTFDFLLADLASLIETLALPAVHLVGHSMGGVIALRYALGRPERVRSLVLVDTAAAPAAATGGIARRVVSLLLEGAAAIATAAAGPREVPGEPAAVAHRGNAGDRQVEGLGRLDPDALVALGRELGDYPSLVDRLGEITCPTTVIVGERDSVLRESAETMARSIPAAHLSVISGADHNPQATRPLAWLAAVDDHFARVDSSPSRPPSPVEPAG